MKRTDIHRPSAIVPDDYEYVAEEFLSVQSLGDALCLKVQREIINAHRATTGGKYSGHEHGGNCMVCGSVNAIYTSLFYHAASNTYVRMGHDCADKCYCGGSFQRNAFRRAIEDAREAHAGKEKARVLLADYGLSEAWNIYMMEYEKLPTDPSAPRKIWNAENESVIVGFHVYYEETTIRDIVGKFVKYGSISEKAKNFLATLLEKIEDRPALEAKKAAERETAADVPTGRVTVEGTVLTIKVQDGPYGSVVKMLVKHESGYKVWGTVPSGLNPEKGDKVRFTAMVEKSKDDPKFGFYKRPTKAMLLAPAWTAPTFEQVVTLDVAV